ncbi:MarR family winged helix-turn-helix transcriptional regulator [Paracoccus ravus]|uniref:MarR family winged helix-turn-helix transcriptional regulator n=1 Tax=Paracoccus ravus TaxID=2447760 RepID=UPI00106DFC52|nr:MarR family winged helix-turn-helix transcriptional regulator [Paracoccus ravus]
MLRNWSQGFTAGNAAYQLNMLANASIKSVDEDFVSLVGLDIRSIRVLRLIGDRPGITFADIVVLAALERSLASRLIQNLVRLGLAERQNDENDARRFGLFITTTGKTVREKADFLSEELTDLLFASFSPDEVSAFMAMMAKLAFWIDSDEYENKSAEILKAAAVKLEKGREAV